MSFEHYIESRLHCSFLKFGDVLCTENSWRRDCIRKALEFLASIAVAAAEMHLPTMLPCLGQLRLFMTSIPFKVLLHNWRKVLNAIFCKNVFDIE